MSNFPTEERQYYREINDAMREAALWAIYHTEIDNIKPISTNTYGNPTVNLFCYLGIRQLLIYKAEVTQKINLAISESIRETKSGVIARVEFALIEKGTGKTINTVSYESSGDLYEQSSFYKDAKPQLNRLTSMEAQAMKRAYMQAALMQLPLYEINLTMPLVNKASKGFKQHKVKSEKYYYDLQLAMKLGNQQLEEIKKKYYKILKSLRKYSSIPELTIKTEEPKEKQQETPKAQDKEKMKNEINKAQDKIKEMNIETPKDKMEVIKDIVKFEKKFKIKFEKYCEDNNMTYNEGYHYLSEKFITKEDIE